MFVEKEIIMFQPRNRRPSGWEALAVSAILLLVLGVGVALAQGAPAPKKAERYVVYSCLVKACEATSRTFADLPACERAAALYPKPDRYGYDFDYHCGREP